MLDLEWSKDKNTRTQHNRLNTGPLHRGNVFNTNRPARVKRWMQWEVPSKPLAVDDPLLLPEREVHAERHCVSPSAMHPRTYTQNHTRTRTQIPGNHDTHIRIRIHIHIHLHTQTHMRTLVETV